MAEDNKFTELKSTLIKAKQPGADDGLDVVAKHALFEGERARAQ